ncbi:L-type lectin-domain containing receptor kinase VIII.1-like protein [Carex littledalei]|uniref:non-specific serine/threonine protein kinase n=1 Tax=Carex littledalei TaxID=544730 RepID=A0A833RJH6_9POAL|nr:L-type lectin-domain containing receptor kinase VIII.1-like protein [Carex littledalei]
MAMPINPISIQLILYTLLILHLHTSPVKVLSLKFDFGTLTLGSLKLLGDAHLKNGSIHLTRDLPVPISSAGRALYSEPVPLRHPTTGDLLPFSTFFSFSIALLNPSSIGGGLAFILSPDDLSVGDAGPYLGLLSASDPPGSFFAVEFDTLMDVQFDDINANHVGVDLGSMVSAQVVDLEAAGVDLKSGNLINVWIDYTSKGVLEISISYSALRPAEPALSFPVDLGKYVNDVAFVGFSASTQGSTEVHSIEWWSFSSPTPATSITAQSPVPPPSPPISTGTGTVITTPPPPPAPPLFHGPTGSATVASAPSNSTTERPPSSGCHGNGLCKSGHGAVAGVATAGAFVAASFAGFALWVFARRAKYRKKSDELVAASEIVSAPRVFTYKELSVATRGFDSSRIIGHGAFGTVYKGIIPETGAIVAVKRCIQNSRGTVGDNGGAQGRAEFLSELSIIAGLRHRNLVRLQGWSCEKGEILLVYDYMLHGSLDKALFDPDVPPLMWRHRKRILIGVASALAYLHRECERQVIHRDVKSSNVMLDEGYHARLGDFGLARQTEHDKSPDATVTAGTMGYLAPEYLLTGRATDKTDVFSFGAVVLEVACGRRPIDSQTNGNLAEWVWRLHGEGRILDSVDTRLEGEYDEGEMRRILLVGLACSSPDPGLRPGMRTVVQMLNGEADPPFVPTSRPSMSFSVNHQLLLSLQDSVSDYNAIVGLNLSTSSSSSSSSLRSTLRGGGGGCQDGHSAV